MLQYCAADGILLQQRIRGSGNWRKTFVRVPASHEYLKVDDGKQITLHAVGRPVHVSPGLCR